MLSSTQFETVSLDTFGGSQGAVIYPQYGWGVKTPAGNFSGYGFVEVAPHEQMFTNHLAVFTPAPTKWFSVHTETGGVPREGLSFFKSAHELTSPKWHRS